MKKLTGLTILILLLAGCQWNPLHDAKGPNQQPSNEPSYLSENENIEQDKQQTEKPTSSGMTKEKEPPDQAEEDELALEAAYFNEVIEVDGKKEIVNAANTLALVNKTFALPVDYTPDDLVRPNVPFSFGNQDIEKSYLRKEAAEALEKMFAAAKKDGIQLYAASGYRSYSRQQEVFEAEVAQSGEKKAAQVVAIPGNSEHQTGLAMDITSESANFFLNEEFGKKPEGNWLQENAHKFGFILRYPKGKEKITGYQYEPWHFRYVGKEAASVMYERNWTLEEYFEHASKI